MNFLSSANTRRKRRRRPVERSDIPWALCLAICSLFFRSAEADPPVTSSIPRSNNRYTHYNDGASMGDSSSSLADISSPLNRESWSPPWNPSSRIDTQGFLTESYLRVNGEWESLANIRGKHGPRNRRNFERMKEQPVRIRQVPGDGNCLFHSIAVCLYRAVNGTDIPMDSHECIGRLRDQSLALRNAAVDVLQQQTTNPGVQFIDSIGPKTRRVLFLQGDEYLEAHELLNAAAAQFDLDGEEYCNLMRKESYWGGGPEIVALCNYLQRPIHIYELIPSDEKASSRASQEKYKKLKVSNQFSLRRMACFGSPKFDRKEPLHILSADSRFPDVEARRVRKMGNHFLALHPVHNQDALLGFRRHAMLRGGSRSEEFIDRERHQEVVGGTVSRTRLGSNFHSKVIESALKWLHFLGHFAS
mmetsp:Transcript_7527/g.17559  ORF Transcript_7527/g.17559 Transcript_7527/m.17559 type:complete len:417 (+) Transcript_7527:83-1333(+)